MAAATDASASPLYVILAEAFAAEGVDTVFTLMGDGNMHWITAMASLPGMRVIHARHEHCACVMAIGHYSATGKVGVASTTCGPGFTQITTALASAAHARIPLVIFAGESPLNHAWHNQMIDQGPIAAAVGAHYIRAHSMSLMLDHLREAFYVARHERKPVVLGVPYDLQQQCFERRPYRSSGDVLPPISPIIPHREDMEALSQRLAHAKRPIILCGRGLLAARAEDQVIELARLSGALLATTLPCRGLFDGDPYSIGVSGGFASPVASALFRDADMVLAIGASLTHHTTDGGHLFPGAFVAQIDAQPLGLRHGRRAADLMIRSDARLAVEELLHCLRAAPRSNSGFRTPAVAKQIDTLFADDEQFDIEPGMSDPRRVVEALDTAIPKDWDIVSGSGHSSYFYTHMRGRRPENFHIIRDFGAIGNGISIAIGVAASTGHGKIVLMEGDGGFTMHIQELETIQRLGLPLLICVFNDGAFGAEIHKLKADGVSDSQGIFGRPDFGAIARGFGLRGTKVTDISLLPSLIGDYAGQRTAQVLDIPISRTVTSPRMRKFNARKH